MEVPSDEETESHVAFVQDALAKGTIKDVQLKPDVSVQLKLGYKLAMDGSASTAAVPLCAEDYTEASEFCDPHGLMYFADYAPKAFRQLRSVCGIDEEHFTRALTSSK